MQIIAVMHQGKVVDLDSSIALRAAKIGHELKLPIADSIIMATAQHYGALVWTQDSDFKGIDGINYIQKG